MWLDYSGVCLAFKGRDHSLTKWILMFTASYIADVWYTSEPDS